MGIFDFFRKKTVIALPMGSGAINKIEGKDKQRPPRRSVQVISPALEQIPLHRKALLYISTEEPKGHGFGLQIKIDISSAGEVTSSIGIPDDPSTIYAGLPVHSPLADEEVPSLGYFPSYSGMEPSQRGLYGQWLRDTSCAIDVGYVFVYYYGLERQLVSGNFDAAVEEILQLRKHHKNSSFQSYSGSALVHACFLRRRLDTLQRLYLHEDFDYFGNSNLLALHYGDLDILPDMLIRLAGCLTGVNRKNLKEKPEVYREMLLEELRKNFGKESYSFASRFPLKNIEGVAFPVFANISLEPNIRTPPLPNFFRHAPFQEEFGNFFKNVHKAVVQHSKINR